MAFNDFLNYSPTLIKKDFLLIRKSKFSPEIFIDIKRSAISFKGRCINMFSEDTFLELEEYISSHHDYFNMGIRLEVDLNFVDTKSQINLFRLIKHCEDIQESGNKILICCKHNPENINVIHFFYEITSLLGDSVKIENVVSHYHFNNN